MLIEFGFFWSLGVLVPLISLFLLKDSPLERDEVRAAFLISAVGGTLFAGWVAYFVFPPLAMPFGQALFWLCTLIILVYLPFSLQGILSSIGTYVPYAVGIFYVVWFSWNCVVAWDVFSSKVFIDIAGPVEMHEGGLAQILDPEHPLLVTKGQAQRKANAESSGFGKYRNLYDLNHVTLSERTQWVVPSEYKAMNLVNWLRVNFTDGLPGYVVIDADFPAESAQLEVLPEGKAIHHSPHGWFWQDTYRTIRQYRPGATFYNTYFHEGAAGEPEYVVAIGRPQRGFFGPVPTELAVQNATTGEVTFFPVGKQPAEYKWLHTKDIAIQRANDWGKYRYGWRHQALNGTDIEHVAMGDFSYEAWPVWGKDGQIYYYLPMQYEGVTATTHGVMMFNAATGKMDFFKQDATNPDQVRVKLNSLIAQRAGAQWEATEPKEYTLAGNLTVYVAAIESDTAVGKTFQQVGVTDLEADVAVRADTFEEAIAEIKARFLKSEKFRSAIADVAEARVTIQNVQSRVEEGNTVYYFTVKELPGMQFRSTYQITSPFMMDGASAKVTYLNYGDLTSNKPIEALSIDVDQ